MLDNSRDIALMANLIKTPILDAIKTVTTSGDKLIGCISPFCSEEGIRSLFGGFRRTESYAYVIARWRIGELLNGVGSVEIFPILQHCGINLFIHRNLHAKLFLFSSGKAICGSGNATTKGLGSAEVANIELAVEVRPDLEDEIYLKKLRDQSVMVTPEIYEAYKNAIESASKGSNPDFDDLVYDTSNSQFLTSSLPAIGSPEEFLKLYHIFSEGGQVDAELRTRFINDLCNFNLDPELDRENVLLKIGGAFQKNEFVKALVKEIRESGPHRFGFVTNFIHTNCRDVPLPYRWEVKRVVQNLYNWLEYFFEDIKWKRPNISQIIYSTHPPN